MAKKNKLSIKGFVVKVVGIDVCVEACTFKDRKDFIESRDYMLNTLGTVNNIDSFYDNKEDAMLRASSLHEYFKEKHADSWLYF